MSGIPLVFMICMASALVAVAGFMATRKIMTKVDISEHQNFLDAMFSIVGTLVSLLLGLLVAASLDHYQNLEQVVESEAAGVAKIFRCARGLPEGPRIKIQGLCIEYCNKILTKEWPAMAHGNFEPGVFDTYRQLADEIIVFRPVHDGQSNLHASMLNSLDEVGMGRRTRILALRGIQARFMVPLLVLGGIIVVALSYLYVSRLSLFHAVVISCVAVALGGNLLTVWIFSRPFEGEWRIKPRAFELNVQALQYLPAWRDRLNNVDQGPAPNHETRACQSPESPPSNQDPAQTDGQKDKSVNKSVNKPGQ